MRVVHFLALVDMVFVLIHFCILCILLKANARLLKDHYAQSTPVTKKTLFGTGKQKGMKIEQAVRLLNRRREKIT